MAPDKIYVGLKDVGSGYIWDISILDNGMEQYIRKDFLLEWLKEKKEWYEGTDFADVYQKVIDKLESL